MVCVGIVAHGPARLIELCTEGVAAHAHAAARVPVVLSISIVLQTAAGVSEESRYGVLHVRVRQQSIWPSVPRVPPAMLVRAARF